MARRLRQINPNALVEITTRTMMGMYLLPAVLHFAMIVVGILFKAREKFPVRIHAIAMVSNHYHMLISVDDAEQLASFMNYFNGNVAREANRLNGWTGSIWDDRYHGIEVVSPDKAVERLEYLLSHSVKEFLVEKVADWEGLHCGPALAAGKPLRGVCYDRTKKCLADRRKKGPKLKRKDWVQDVTLELAPLPCWEELPKATRQKRVRKMIRKIEKAAAKARARPVVGMATIQRQDPRSHPAHVERSPIPLVHGSREIYKTYREIGRAHV